MTNAAATVSKTVRPNDATDLSTFFEAFNHSRKEVDDVHIQDLVSLFTRTHSSNPRTTGTGGSAGVCGL